jgi:hypothetical protein
MGWTLFVFSLCALFAFHVAALWLRIGVYWPRLFDCLVLPVVDWFIRFLFAFERRVNVGSSNGLGTRVCMRLLYGCHKPFLGDYLFNVFGKHNVSGIQCAEGLHVLLEGFLFVFHASHNWIIYYTFISLPFYQSANLFLFLILANKIYLFYEISLLIISSRKDFLKMKDLFQKAFMVIER